MFCIQQSSVLMNFDNEVIFWLICSFCICRSLGLVFLFSGTYDIHSFLHFPQVKVVKTEQHVQFVWWFLITMDLSNLRFDPSMLDDDFLQDSSWGFRTWIIFSTTLTIHLVIHIIFSFHRGNLISPWAPRMI